MYGGSHCAVYIICIIALLETNKKGGVQVLCRTHATSDAVRRSWLQVSLGRVCCPQQQRCTAPQSPTESFSAPVPPGHPQYHLWAPHSTSLTPHSPTQSPTHFCSPRDPPGIHLQTQQTLVYKQVYFCSNENTHLYMSPQLV